MSVIVPVYEPDAGFDELMASLDRQTMSADRFEVILCDDGSGPATGRRLEDAARHRPNVRVLSLTHTGWPGTPRNRGIEEARGEYVFFSDQDDRLFDDALRRMCAYADRHSSDVVIGREVGVGRRMPGRIFRRDVPHAQLGRDPLLEVLTPHKLFRTAFLREHGIRFPEGRVRLEDHLFVMKAYFTARTISILASSPCYAWVKRRGSASSSRIDPATYFPHLISVVDLVEENTEPGALRDELLRHWYRGKILKRLEGRRMARYPDDHRAALLDAVIPIARDRFGEGVEAGLSAPHRIRSALLRSGRRDDLLRFAEYEAQLSCRAVVIAAHWSRGGGLHLVIDARVLRSGMLTDGPESAGEAWTAPGRGGSSSSRKTHRDQVEVFTADASGRGTLRFAAHAPLEDAKSRVAVDPVAVFDGESTVAARRLFARVRIDGWLFESPLEASVQLVGRPLARSPLLAGRLCRLAIDDDGSLELRREWPRGRHRDLVARGVRALRRRVRRATRTLARRGRSVRRSNRPRQRD